MKKIVLYVEQMHCNSCVLLMKNTFKNIPGVRSVLINLSNKSVQLNGEFKQKEKILLKKANKILNPLGYTVTRQKLVEKNNFPFMGLVAGLVILLIYWQMQKLDFFRYFELENGNWWTPLLIGVVASLSTCMSVVGGLILSTSATWAKMGHKTAPQILFLVCRLVGFIVLGGVLGLIGKRLALNWQIALGMQIMTSIVMIFLGLNLLGNGSRLQFNFFSILNKYLIDKKDKKNWIWVAILGAGTFFLPCGFTQSMQAIAIESSSLINGARIMGLFATGTMPILSLVAFSGKILGAGKHASIFFATVGTIIVGLALFNLVTVLKLILL